MWRSPIFPAGKCRKYAGKTGFWAFSRNFIINFFLIFFTKMLFSNAQNMTEFDFWRKFFLAENDRNMPEIAVFADFYWTYTKTLIAMPPIKHGLIFNKTDFCSRSFLKIAGTADFRRKNGISWISRAVIHISSWNFAH